jgi:hypothetical protein
VVVVVLDQSVQQVHQLLVATAEVELHHLIVAHQLLMQRVVKAATEHQVALQQQAQ